MAGPILLAVYAADVVVGEHTGPHDLCTGVVVIRLFDADDAVFEDGAHQAFDHFIRQADIRRIGKVALGQMDKHICNAAGCLVGGQRHGKLGIQNAEHRTQKIVGTDAFFDTHFSVGNHAARAAFRAGGCDGEDTGNRQNLGIGFFLDI